MADAKYLLQQALEQANTGLATPLRAPVAPSTQTIAYKRAQQQAQNTMPTAIDATRSMVQEAIKGMNGGVSAVASSVSGAMSQTKATKAAQAALNAVGKAGGSRSWRNNNPGNIQYGDFAKKYGAVGTDGRFALFKSEEDGYKAQAALLSNKNYNSKTVKDAIYRWAPPSDGNDSEGYALKVAKQLGIDPNTPMTAVDKVAMAKAMASVEGWDSKKETRLTKEQQAAQAAMSVQAPVVKLADDKRVEVAKSIYTELKKAGVKVDGYGMGMAAVSAEHNKTNPGSDHEKGKAFDYHVDAPDNAKAEQLIQQYAPQGLRYVIHNNLIYQAKNNWKPEPYGGKFKNGAAKSDHKNHIHLNF